MRYSSPGSYHCCIAGAVVTILSRRRVGSSCDQDTFRPHGSHERTAVLVAYDSTSNAGVTRDLWWMGGGKGTLVTNHTGAWTSTPVQQADLLVGNLQGINCKVSVGWWVKVEPLVLRVICV